MFEFQPRVLRLTTTGEDEEQICQYFISDDRFCSLNPRAAAPLVITSYSQPKISIFSKNECREMSCLLNSFVEIHMKYLVSNMRSCLVFIM